MVQNGPKMGKKVQNCSNSPNSLEGSKTVTFFQNGLKYSNMVQYGPKLSKMVPYSPNLYKMNKIVRNFPNCLKFFQNTSK